MTERKIGEPYDGVEYDVADNARVTMYRAMESIHAMNIANGRTVEKDAGPLIHGVLAGIVQWVMEASDADPEALLDAIQRIVEDAIEQTKLMMESDKMGEAEGRA